MSADTAERGTATVVRGGHLFDLELPKLGLVAVHVEAEASPYPADPGPTSQAEDRALFQRRLSD